MFICGMHKKCYYLFLPNLLIIYILINKMSIKFSYDTYINKANDVLKWKSGALKQWVEELYTYVEELIIYCPNYFRYHSWEYFVKFNLHSHGHVLGKTFAQFNRFKFLMNIRGFLNEAIMFVQIRCNEHVYIYLSIWNSYHQLLLFLQSGYGK